jgi:VanZ family protein
MYSARISALLCVSVLLGILAAGLTPFRQPRNAVTWLGNENGLHFGRYGTVWSAGGFQAGTLQHEGQHEGSCSIEIWLRPDVADASKTIFAFYTPENPLQLVAIQYHALFILKRERRDDSEHPEVIGIADALHSAKSAFVSITSGAQGSAIYVDGKLVRRFPAFRIGKDCGNALEIGTSPVTSDSWTGELRGLAIYGRELSEAEVQQHYETWTTVGRPAISEDEQAMGVYLFEKRSGSVVHNAVAGGIDLNIPKRFSLVHQIFLQPFWKEFRPRRSYFIDLLVNIAGFVPLGFVFCAHWTSVRPMRHAVLATIALGFAVSLTIEVLQSYLPTRDSGTTDLITNTLGTFLGVKLYSSRVARAVLAKIY